MGKTANYIVVGLVCLALLGIGYLGYTIYPKINKCPDIVADTVIIKDTVFHYIPDTIPYYIVRHDSIVYRDTVFKDVDTAEILKDYFALHYYTRLWEDSLLKVVLEDVISQNKSIDNTFTYQILRPQTIENNVTNIYNYSRYFTAGLNFALKDLTYTGAEITYVSPTWYGGVGYNFGIKGVTVRGGGVIKRFK